MRSASQRRRSRGRVTIPPAPTALWALADAQVAAGLHEDAVSSAGTCAALPVQGFPGSGERSARRRSGATRARSALRRSRRRRGLLGLSEPSPRRTRSLRSGARILAGCRSLHARGQRLVRRVRAVGIAMPLVSGGRRVLRGGDRRQAIALLATLEDDAPVWLRRRADATRRAAGAPASNLRPDTRHEVVVRVARGLTTKQIARGLAVSPSTVETHVRSAMTRCSATTRPVKPRSFH